MHILELNSATLKCKILKLLIDIKIQRQLGARSRMWRWRQWGRLSYLALEIMRYHVLFTGNVGRIGGSV